MSRTMKRIEFHIQGVCEDWDMLHQASQPSCVYQPTTDIGDICARS